MHGAETPACRRSWRGGPPARALGSGPPLRHDGQVTTVDVHFPLPLPALLRQIDRLQTEPLARSAVRDLAWLLFAPAPLPADPAVQRWLCPWSEEWATDWQARVLQLAQAPSPLLQAITPAPRRLGLYAEALLAYWLASTPQLQLLLRHHPVRADRRTVGEFDFVVRSHTGLVHLELAVKFFLGLPGAHAMQHWPGTSLDDSLHIKWQHLLQHQLQLADHPAAAQVLPEPLTDRWSWFRGWLFQPLQGAATLPGLAPDYCSGVWGPPAQLLDHWGHQAPVAWLPLLQRLAPASRLPPPQSLADAVREWQAGEAPYPRLLARVQTDADGVQETARAFIVPDDWLQRATEAGFSP